LPETAYDGVIIQSVISFEH